MSKIKGSAFIFAKSVFIVGYIIFIFWAGLSVVFGWHYGGLTYPWLNFDFFVGYSLRHVDWMIAGMDENGARVTLDLAEIFPMPPKVIERGSGVAFSGLLWLLEPKQRAQLGWRLCDYALKKYNIRAQRSNQLKLLSAEVLLVSWRLTGPGRPDVRKINFSRVVQCSRPQ